MLDLNQILGIVHNLVGHLRCKVNLGTGLETRLLFLVSPLPLRAPVVGGRSEDGKEEGGEVWRRGESSHEG